MSAADHLDYTDDDGLIFQQELADFVPARVFDAHVHLFDRTCVAPSTELPPKSCYRKFGGVFTVEQWRQWTAALLPGRQVHFNGFGHPGAGFDRDASADYWGGICDNRSAFGMALVSPHDSPQAVARRLDANRLIGYKPYLAFVDWKPAEEVTIQDMLPEALMDLASARGLAVTLHIPRPGRLEDPVNREQMVSLCRRWPRVSVIFAHVGRAYYMRGVEGLLDGLADCPNAYVDTAMVNHEGVLEYTLANFPRGRILFGSDAPIALLRGKSVEINNQYAYLMGEDYEIGTSIHDAGAGVRFTSFFYEQLRGLKRAAGRAGLDAAEVEDVFFNNAQRLFSSIAQRNYATGRPS